MNATCRYVGFHTLRHADLIHSCHRGTAWVTMTPLRWVMEKYTNWYFSRMVCKYHLGSGIQQTQWARHIKDVHRGLPGGQNRNAQSKGGGGGGETSVGISQEYWR